MTDLPTARRAELRPCPFCGGNVAIRRKLWNAQERWQIQCAECSNGTDDRYETQAYAEAAWNRRTTEPVADAEVARLVNDLRVRARGPATDYTPAVMRDAADLIERLARELAETRSHG